VEIEQYHFGRIVIGGQAFTSDVIVYPDRVAASWWRKEGHRLDRCDLGEIVAAQPRHLVIGTGYHGRMAVPQETLGYLEAQGIVAHVAPTSEAVALFNRLQREAAAVVAALHLTC
jgi:hypothetical protein